MANFTFDPALSTPKDQVRWRTGDVDGLPQWFNADETIYAMLALHDYDEVCAQCAEAVAAQLAQLATSVQQSKLRIEYQRRSDVMFKLADRIRDLAQPEPDDPVYTGAASGQPCTPGLRDMLIELPCNSFGWRPWSQ